MGSQLSGLVNILYNSKRREFLGRDGVRWAKLAVFYCFYYLGLAGFFCLMVTVLMASTPRDSPRYYSNSSRMQTRSNPLSPGLGFRPQPDVDKNIIVVDKNISNYEKDRYVKNLNQYLGMYYWNEDNDYSTGRNKFLIKNPDICIPENQYGFSRGKPCVLVKMNKIVGFMPVPGYQSEDENAYKAGGCRLDLNPNAIAVQCYGEYPIDVDNIGNIAYISENNQDDKCGSLETKWFPYKGKNDRRDVYQAPYVWIQFQNPKPNILINVICRVYAENISFDRKTSRALTRFQIYIKDLSNREI